jgi:hypothetical protein
MPDVEELVSILLDESTDEIVKLGSGDLPPLMDYSHRQKISSLRTTPSLSSPTRLSPLEETDLVNRLYKKPLNESFIMKEPPMDLSFSRPKFRPPPPKAHVPAPRLLTSSLRQRAADQRRQALIQDTIHRESVHLKFKPDINPQSAAIASRMNSSVPNVTERLTRDIELRRSRMEQKKKLRESEIMAECRAFPKISAMARNIYRSDSLSRVDESSFIAPTHSISFQDFVSSKRPPTRSLHSLELSDIFEFTRRN